jgi:hypothetical protein
MRATDLILIGEAIGDEDAAKYGYGELDRFQAYTATCGIHEFDSPTYYCTDLNSLYMGARYAKNPAPFRTILDLFWRDVAENYFPAQGTLSGPHSRDYDFLTSAGGIDLYTWAAKLMPRFAFRSIDPEKVYVVAALQDNDTLSPPPNIPTVDVPRTVRAIWGPKPGQDRINYIDRGFAIGSASADYGAQDKLISVELSGAGVDITVVPDTTDQPYGKLKTKDSSGHDKPTHLPLAPVCVQDKGLLLATLAVNPHKAGLLSSLATNVLLPANARIAVDGIPVASNAPFAQALTTGSVVTVATPDAVAAIRVFHADGAGGASAQLILKADRLSLKYGVIRFAAYAYQGASTTLADTQARVGLLIEARNRMSDGDIAAVASDLQGAKIDDTAGGGAWQVSADVAGRKLALSRDASTGAILSRSVEGHAYP